MLERVHGDRGFDGDFEEPRRFMRARGFAVSLGRSLLRRPLDTLGATTAAALTVAVLVNALYMQPGPHPSPIAGAPLALPPVKEMTGATGSLATAPRPRPIAHNHAAPATPEPATTRQQLLGELQRELGQRGYYDGAIDSVYGPKMDAAIREFEQAAGLRVTGDPTPALLHAVSKSSLKAQRSRSPPTADRAVEAQAPGPSRRVAAVQRALTDFGYGQLKLSGVRDAPTKAAIEKFERDRKLPVRGDITERFLRELAAVTGRPLE